MKKPLILVGFMFLLLLLACGGTVDVSEENVRVTGLPQFVCPSSTPRPTDTAVPTRTQMPTAAPVVINTPMVYVPYPPVCNYAAAPSYQYICAPNACLPSFTGCGMAYTYPLATPNPSGYWSGGGTGLGPTSTPRPTFTPYPTRTPYPSPTPYVVSENYPMGADVYVGGEGSLQLRFRVSNPRITPISASRQVVIWDIEIGNIGTIRYNALPGAQVFVSHLLVAGQAQAGYWYASAEAALAANIALDERVLDIVEVAPNETVRLTLTAFTPIGEVYKIAWLLDPYSGGTGSGVVGGNTVLWLNQPDPNNCMGNVGDGFVIPSPSAPASTATPSVTPYIPPYSGYGD
jgi:hypothetical protein